MLNGVENMKRGQRQDAGKVHFLVAVHGKGFATGRLAVGKQRAVDTLQGRVHDGSGDGIEEIVGAVGRCKDVVVLGRGLGLGLAFGRVFGQRCFARPFEMFVARFGGRFTRVQWSKADCDGDLVVFGHCLTLFGVRRREGVMEVRR